MGPELAATARKDKEFLGYSAPHESHLGMSASPSPRTQPCPRGLGGGGMWQPSRDIHSSTFTFLSEGSFGSENDQPCCPAASGTTNTVPTACVDNGNPYQLYLDF